ncbi:MAG: hypothetical protein WAX44_03130 [Minisyncoccia bacterium]
MGKPALHKSEVLKIKKLRKTGHTLSEIKTIVNRGYGTIFRYVKSVSISSKYRGIWAVKRGGSKLRSIKEWNKSRDSASKILKSFDFKEKMIVLACLYWVKETKKN